MEQDRPTAIPNDNGRLEAVESLTSKVGADQVTVYVRVVDGR